MPAVKSTCEAPIARCPEQAHTRRRHPHARNPVIAGLPIAPVTRCPEISLRGAGWRDIDRQCRRSNSDRYPNRNLRKRSCGNDQQEQQKQESSRFQERAHKYTLRVAILIFEKSSNPGLGGLPIVPWIKKYTPHPFEQLFRLGSWPELRPDVLHLIQHGSRQNVSQGRSGGVLTGNWPNVRSVHTVCQRDRNW
jgi:hypothetical protein